MAGILEISPPKRPRPTRDRVCDEDEEHILFLAPFRPTPKVFFRSVKVNVSATRRVTIRNPSSSAIIVELPNLPPQDRCFQFNFTSAELEAGGEAKLEVTWTPSKAGRWHETVPVHTSSKFKTVISIIATSIDPTVKKNVGKLVTSKALSKPTVSAKKLVDRKPQSRLSKPRTISSVVHQQVPVAGSLSNSSVSSPCRRQTFLINGKNKDFRGRKLEMIHENPSPGTSRRFVDLVLSPENPDFSNQQARYNALDTLVMSPGPSTPSVAVKKAVVSKRQSQLLKRQAISRIVNQQVHASLSPNTSASSPCRRETFLVHAENKENMEVKVSKVVEKHAVCDVSKRLDDLVLTPVNFNINVKQATCDAENIVMSPIVEHNRGNNHSISKLFEDLVLSPVNPDFRVHQTRYDWDDFVISPTLDSGNLADPEVKSSVVGDGM